MKIGKIIEQARKKKKMSQVALGKEMGVSRQRICDWEKGRSEPRVKTFMKISEILEIEIKKQMFVS